MSISNFWKILKNSGTQYLADQVPRLGAAIAYYTVFSIVPLLTVTITLVGLIFGTEAVQSHILAQMSALLGTKGTDAIKDMLEQAARPQTGLQAGTIALLTLLAGATGLFDTKDVGTGKTVNISGLVLAGADVLHGSSPDPTVEQILAKLPKDERRVLLSLIRA